MLQVLTPKIAEPFERFFRKVVRGSYLLFLTTILALLWANTYPEGYYRFWHTGLSISIGPFEIARSLAHWIDEALMTLFFFAVGLEIKREILVGELSSPKRAILPIAAALGGMLCPAGLYMVLNYSRDSFSGWGIPMATDIAFSLAVLSALGSRAPFGLRVFLSALAIADDLGAVLVIAVFYTSAIQSYYLFVSGLFLAGLYVVNRLWSRWMTAYVVLGMGLWFSILSSGIHATVAGVLLAMFIPASSRYDTDTFIRKVKGHLETFQCENGSCGYTILLNERHLNAVQAIEMACRDVETPLQRMETGLESWITTGILPLFALANAGLVIRGMDIAGAISHPVTLGTCLGLILGKPVGIFVFTYLGFKLLKAPLPTGVRWPHIAGAGLLGGIGFTMSLFISGLSFTSPEFTAMSKLGILAGSLISGLTGYGLLLIFRGSR